MRIKKILVLFLIIVMGITACEKKESTSESNKKETEGTKTESSKEPSDLEQEGEEGENVKEETDKKVEVIYNTQSEYVRDGEWLYYVEGELYSDLYRMKLDGSYKQNLTGESGMESRGGTVIVGDWVYTTAKSGSGERFWTGTIKVKKDGSEWCRVYDEMLDMYDEKYGEYDNENGIHIVSIEDQDDTIVAYINDVWYVYDIIDDYIYYYSEDESFRRVKMDTNNEEVLIDSSEEAENIIISDSWIYYSINKEDGNNPKEWSGSVYRKRLDGSENELIISRKGGGLYAAMVYNNKVYCDGYECVDITQGYYKEKPYFIVIDMENREEKTVGTEDMKTVGIAYQYETEYEGENGEWLSKKITDYNDIELRYIDDEYVVFCVFREQDGEEYRYDLYICDLNGTNIVKLD